MTFETWFQTYLAETDKVNLDHTFEVITDSGTMHLVDMRTLRANILHATREEKKVIKDTIVKIDFANGDPMRFFNHLALCMAQSWEKANHSALAKAI